MHYSHTKKVFKIIGLVLLLYIIASIIMSLCWYTNGIGNYDGPRYGLLAVEIHSTTLTNEPTYSGNGYMGYSKEGYCIAYDNKFKPGDKVITVSMMNPFSRYDDDCIRLFDIKIN